jgi:ABC-type amino acid transport substrate-binding protein
VTFWELDLKLFNKLLSIFCFIFFSSSLFAIEQQPLVIVMGADSYPYQFVDDQGEPQGLLVELWRDWSMHTGNEIEFIAHPWTVGLDELAMGNVSAHIGMAVTPERLKHFDFAVPISTVNTYLYVNHSLIKKRKISDLQPYKIGIVSGSSHEEDLLTIEPGLGFKHYGNRQDLLQGALAGEVLVFAGMEGQLNNNIINRQIVPLFPISNRLLIKQVKLQPAVKKTKVIMLMRSIQVLVS